MADEKKKGGWFSRFKQNKPENSPSADAGSAQQATVSPKPAPPAKPAPKAKPAPAAQPAPAPAPKQVTPNKKTASRENTVTMEPIDTVASIQNYIDSLLSLGASQLKVVDMTLKGVSEFLDKHTQSLRQNQK